MQTVGQLLKIKGTEVFSVGPQDSVLHAIEVMATRHVGALLVMSQGSLVGIISERDYARKVILKNRSSHDTPVGDIMTASPVSVAPEDTVHHCMQLMTEGRFRHLPVVNDSGKLLGILSIRNLLEWRIDGLTQELDSLEHYVSNDGPGG